MERGSPAFDGYPRFSVQDQDLSGYGTNGKGVQFGALFLFANVLYSTAIAGPVVHSHYYQDSQSVYPGLGGLHHATSKSLYQFTTLGYCACRPGRNDRRPTAAGTERAGPSL